MPLVGQIQARGRTPEHEVVSVVAQAIGPVRSPAGVLSDLGGAGKTRDAGLEPGIDGRNVQFLARSNAAATAAIAGAAHSGLARLGVEEALVLLELEPSDHAAVNRVGAVGDAQGAGHRV